MTKPSHFSWRLLRRWLRDQRGGEAIEMAVVGAPFIALVCGLVELGLVFLTYTTLENATDEVSRQIRTGAVQTSGGGSAAIKAAICDEMSWLGTQCASNLNLDVRTFTSFSGQNAPPNPVNGGVVNPANFCWDPGGAGSIVLVRGYYTWTLFVPVLNSALVNAGGNKRLITSAISFRNEPYTNTATPPVTCPSLP
jgi:Flp pilus assembly protein TadG